LHYRIGAARFPKKAKYQLYCTPHFFVGIRDNTALLVKAITDGQWKPQLALFGFVQLTAEQAQAQKM
jgi:hypothetical protein